MRAEICKDQEYTLESLECTIRTIVCLPWMIIPLIVSRWTGVTAWLIPGRITIQGAMLVQRCDLQRMKNTCGGAVAVNRNLCAVKGAISEWKMCDRFQWAKKFPLHTLHSNQHVSRQQICFANSSGWCSKLETQFVFSLSVVHGQSELGDDMWKHKHLFLHCMFLWKIVNPNKDWINKWFFPVRYVQSKYLQLDLSWFINTCDFHSPFSLRLWAIFLSFFFGWLLQNRAVLSNLPQLKIFCVLCIE